MIAVTGTVVNTDYAQLWSANKFMGTEMHVVQGRDKCATRHNNQVLKTLFILYDFPEL